MTLPRTLAIGALAFGAVTFLVLLEPRVTSDSAKAALRLTFPMFLMAEIVYLGYVLRQSPSTLKLALKIPLMVFALHIVLAPTLMVEMGWVLPAFSRLAPSQLPMNLAGFLIAYVIWEFAHYVHHWSCHKVRLFWCLHAPHHAAEHMNLAVTHVNFLYLGIHASLIRLGICAAAGIPLPMLLLVAAVDNCWGGLVHVSEEAWKEGRLHPLLERCLMSPYHHRIHHASNPEYIDKNYCHLLPLWDKVFGTFQDKVDGVQIRYGLARPIKSGSFADLYFGEFRLLARDLLAARSASDALLYLVMPPGWKPRSQRQNLRSAAGAD